MGLKVISIPRLVVNLAEMTERLHASLTGVGATDHLTALVQTMQETEVAGNRAYNPSLARFAPGSAKVWARVSGDGTIGSSYNVTSSAKDATGEYTITIADDFSDGDYSVVGTVVDATAIAVMMVDTRTAGSYGYEIRNASILVDRDAHTVAFGEQV